MPNVRKMTNEGLLRGVRGCFMDRGFICLPDELDELARRVGIMEELCEAPKPHGHLLSCICARCERHNKALTAYRAMKGEQNAKESVR